MRLVFLELIMRLVLLGLIIRLVFLGLIIRLMFLGLIIRLVFLGLIIRLMFLGLIMFHAIIRQVKESAWIGDAFFIVIVTHVAYYLFCEKQQNMGTF